MLVLNRKLGEAIVIGHSVEVVVLGVKQGVGENVTVKLGIDAPKHIDVNRKEVELQHNQENAHG